VAELKRQQVGLMDAFDGISAICSRRTDVSAYGWWPHLKVNSHEVLSVPVVLWV